MEGEQGVGVGEVEERHGEGRVRGEGREHGPQTAIRPWSRTTFVYCKYVCLCVYSPSTSVCSRRRMLRVRAGRREKEECVLCTISWSREEAARWRQPLRKEASCNGVSPSPTALSTVAREHSSSGTVK